MTSSRPVRRTLLSALSVLLLTSAAVAGEQTLQVAVDRAIVVRAADNTATVVVGNPMIADATTQKNGVMVVTGKSYGSTNVMLLDGGGAVLSETVVNVTPSTDGWILVQRGGIRESLSCTPRCAPVLSIGDDEKLFKVYSEQIGKRGGLSTGKDVE